MEEEALIEYFEESENASEFSENIERNNITIDEDIDTTEDGKKIKEQLETETRQLEDEQSQSQIKINESLKKLFRSYKDISGLTEERLSNFKMDGSDKELEDLMRKKSSDISEGVKRVQEYVGEADKKINESPNTVDKLRTFLDEYSKKIGITGVGVLFLGALIGTIINIENELKNKSLGEKSQEFIGCAQINIATGIVKNLGLCGQTFPLNGRCDSNPPPFCNFSSYPCNNAYNVCSKKSCSPDPGTYIEPVCGSPTSIFLLMEILSNNTDVWSYPNGKNPTWLVGIIIALLLMLVIFVVFYFIASKK